MDQQDEVPPRITQRVVITPLPQARDAWIIWPEEKDLTADHEPDGPFDVVAIAHQEFAVSWDGKWETRRVSEGPKAGQNLTSFSGRFGRGVGPGSIESAATGFFHDFAFLVLAPDTGQWDRLLIPQEKVFFSLDAARAAVAERVAEYADWRSREAAKATGA